MVAVVTEFLREEWAQGNLVLICWDAVRLRLC